MTQDPTVAPMSPREVERHDDLQVCRFKFADRTNHARMGSAQELYCDFRAVHSLERVSQVATVEGDVQIITSYAGVQLALVVTQFGAGAPNRHAGQHRLLHLGHGPRHR